jgi:hypothetical protein
MPFYAAGIHLIGTTENAYCRAVSSYAPLIKALAYARKRDKDLERVHGSLLIATMLATPAMGSLRGVIHEKDKVLEVSKGHIAVEHMEEPSVNYVLEGL